MGKNSKIGKFTKIKKITKTKMNQTFKVLLNKQKKKIDNIN